MKKPEAYLLPFCLSISLLILLLRQSLQASTRDFQHYGHLISIALLTPIIIILWRYFPKIIAINNSVTITKTIVARLGFLHRALLPSATS
jgi:CBS domain containing-hemolysin-like protein